MRCPLRAAAIVAVTALLAGCGATGSSEDASGDFRGEQQLVANAVEGLQSAAADGDEAKICRDLLSRSLADRLASRAGGSCERAVDAAIKDADTFDVSVQTVQIAGQRATARVKSETGEKDKVATLQVVRERGAWRIAQL